jgi:probable F420-dependent oxidoreductase
MLTARKEDKVAKDSMRFSIQIPGAPDAAAWADKVRRAEDLGFYSVSVPDHLSPGLPQLAPVAALTAAAMITSRLRLAITVINNDFRHPVMLAKEIATLDLLSGGRVDLGLGAGWLPADYTASGIRSWDPAAERVARLEEAVVLLGELFTGAEVTFAGEHYQVAGYVSLPRPAQAHIPIIIGGSGRRMLTFAARHADIISIVVNNPRVDSSVKGLEERLGWIADAGGRDRTDLMVGLRIVAGTLSPPGTSRHEAAESIASARGVPVTDVLDSPFTLVGDQAAIKDRIVEFHERYGISYFTLSEDFAWEVGNIVGELGSPP